jgi:tryptophan synthase alpha chain
VTRLLQHLDAQRRRARKLLVPYVMGGIPEASAFEAVARALAAHADALEIGLPYSDPLMDGPVIAAAGERVLRAGLGPLEVLDLVAPTELAVPRVVMTYFNPVHRLGEDSFCRRAAGAGFSGLIVPDIPLEESATLRRAAAAAELAWVPLVAPTTSPERARRIADTASGFIYAVSTLGVTGTRAELARSAARVVASCRAATDLPVLVGIGISSPEQARAAVAAADGVVIGSAVVRLVLDEGPAAGSTFLAGVRAALDGVEVAM